MTSENQSSPANKRQLSMSSEPANSPTTPDSKKKVKTNAGHEATPTEKRLQKSNKILGKANSELRKKVQELEVRIAELEYMTRKQLEVITLNCFVEALNEALAADENSQNSQSTQASTGDAPVQAQVEGQQEENEPDRDDDGEPDADATA